MFVLRRDFAYLGLGQVMTSHYISDPTSELDSRLPEGATEAEVDWSRAY